MRGIPVGNILTNSPTRNTNLLKYSASVSGEPNLVHLAEKTAIMEPKGCTILKTTIFTYPAKNPTVNTVKRLGVKRIATLFHPRT